MEREQLVYGFLPASLAIPARESVRKSVGTAPAGNDPLEALRGTFGTEVPTADVVNAAWEQVYERLFAARGYPSDARARAAVAQDTDAMLLFPARPGPSANNPSFAQLRSAQLPADAAARARQQSLDQELAGVEAQLRGLADSIRAEKAAKGVTLTPLQAADLARMDPRGQEIVRRYRLARHERDSL